MSKIYDALEHARKSRIRVDIPQEPSLPPLPAVNLGQRVSTDGVDMEQEMITLYQTITAALPDTDHRSILFVGSKSNEGTSTIARQLAKAVSLGMEKKVLLIDLDRSRPDLHVYADLKPVEDGGSENSTETALCQIEESSLFVMPLFQRTMMTPRTLDSAKENAFWEPLRERFDLIIVDAPPATTFPDSLAVASQVDGVILVVEAEKTRWRVALNVREKIETHGGNVLGMVFNKRKFYIPDFIYRHL
ncbi:MAG: Tyrosine-protein kinase YwqD [Syntrophorhabdus sp. PtaU1.Bin153]|nr:MAG: Tyrosine-protein kinase YwqD [Syntrophorhabdus sp. PtaU1.Bin153]